MEYNTKLYLLVLYIGFLAPFLLRGLTWAMLYVWTKNYPQVVGTCSGHHGQLISQNCVLTKIGAEPPYGVREGALRRKYMLTYIFFVRPLLEHGVYEKVCMQDTFARATHSA